MRQVLRLTLDRVVGAFEGACVTDAQRAWVDAFRLRSLTLEASGPA